MSDRIALSLWFGSQSGPQMLPRLAEAIACLPNEVQAEGIHAVSVWPLSWSEPALVEERFPGGIESGVALARMREFLHTDCACEAGVRWRLWEWSGGAWRLQPCALTLCVLGTEFEDGIWREQGHLRLDFGLDEWFFGELAPPNDAARRHLEYNILRLLGVVRALQHRLKPERRRLWSETDADLTGRLLDRLTAAHV